MKAHRFIPILVLLVLARADAGQKDCFKILDDQPKVIFYLSNSHKGTTGLRRHLKEAGFDHIKVRQNLFGFLLKLDPKTGTWSPRSPLGEIKKEWKKDFKDMPAVIVYQNNNANIPMPKSKDDWPEARKKMKDWAAPTDGKYFALMRRKLKEEGFSELYIQNHHYSRTAAKVDHPRWLKTIEEYNKLTGCTLGVDTWPATKRYYPRTVGADYWHNNEFGRLAKTWSLMQAMAENSGIEKYKQIDLDKALKEYEAGHLHITDVTPVGKGQVYAIGDTVEITWKIDDPDLYPHVDLYLELEGTTHKLKIAEKVASAREHYRWTIRDRKLASPHGGRAIPVTSDRCRVRVVWTGTKHMVNSGIGTGVFAIAEERPEGTSAPKLGNKPAPLAGNEHKTGDVTYRIARFPDFYRGALAIVIKDNDPELLESLKIFAGREHPDLVSVLVDPRDAKEKAARWKKMDDLGHEIVFEHGRVEPKALRTLFDKLGLKNTARPVTVTRDASATGASLVIDGKQNAYRQFPEDLSTLRSYHIRIGSEKAMRKAMEDALDRRALAVVTFDSRGEDFGKQINALHDRQDELWNGSFDRIVRYLSEARSARLTVKQYDRDAARFELSDDLPDRVYDVPLFFQVEAPHWQWSQVECMQGKTKRWCVHRSRRKGNMLRFMAVPDAGSITLKP